MLIVYFGKCVTVTPLKKIDTNIHPKLPSKYQPACGVFGPIFEAPRGKCVQYSESIGPIPILVRDRKAERQMG